MLCKDSSNLHKGVVRGLGNDQANCNLNTLNFIKTIDVSTEDHVGDNHLYHSLLFQQQQQQLLEV